MRGGKKKKKWYVSFTDSELELKKKNLSVKIIMTELSVVNRFLPLSPLMSKSSPFSKYWSVVHRWIRGSCNDNSFYMDCKILLKGGGYEEVLLKVRKVILLKTWSSGPLKNIAWDVLLTEKCECKIWYWLWTASKS